MPIQFTLFFGGGFGVNASVTFASEPVTRMPRARASTATPAMKVPPMPRMWMCTASGGGVAEPEEPHEGNHGNGLAGDAHGGDWHRQVSLLATEQIQTMRDKGLDVTAGSFAENITTEGFDLDSVKVGDRIKVGASALLEVTQIGKECHHGCAIKVQVGDCIMPREGIFTKVIVPGTVYVGDEIEVMNHIG